MAQEIDFTVAQQTVDFSVENTLSSTNIITVNVYVDDVLQSTSTINGHEDNTLNITAE